MSKNIENILGLSPMQEGMLFHHLLDEKNDIYVLQMKMILEGELNIDFLKESYMKLIKKYDIFRSAIVYKEVKVPRLVILKEREGEFNHEDITHLDNQEQDRFIEEFINNDRMKGFDFEHDILLRISVVKKTETRYFLLITMHHIIIDGWSFGLVFGSLMEYYLDSKKQKPSDTESVYTYSTYLRWIAKQDKETNLNYWRDYLENYEVSRGLLVSGSSMEGGEVNRKAIKIKIDKKLTGRIEEFSRENGMTVNNVLQAVYGILLQKYLCSDDVVFGNVISGRPPEIDGVERIAGLFINTIPLRVSCGEKDTFKELSKRIYRDFKNNQEHGYLSLIDIQKCASLQGQLFDCLFIYENFPVEQSYKASPGLDDPGFKVINQSSAGKDGEEFQLFADTNYDLNFIVFPGEELT
ncbi:MAG: hypothetical protein JXB88_20410, partial [Spirochaetales bacterium]|nr:hypothetical protein [Spirochaetales bacterium]